MASGQEMAAEAEKIVARAMSRKKPLSLPKRFEAAHVALSLSCGLMRDFGSSVQPLALAVFNAG
jgi:hypothetical protein